MGYQELQPMQHKRLRTFRQGRISARKIVREQQRVRNNLEKSVFRKLQRAFKQNVSQAAFLYKEFGIVNEQQLARSIDEDILPILFVHYQRVFKSIFDLNEATYDMTTKQVDVTIFGRNMDLERLIEIYNRGRQLFLSGISLLIADKVATIITVAREEGLSLTSIARKITKEVTPLGRSRAALIARTETHNAASYAHHQYHTILQDSIGTKMVKRWSATNDARTRNAHSIANGQTVPMDEPFIVDGAEMMHAGDPNGGARNNVNCRCVILYADEEDIIDN
jgi:hypothetical protein